MLKTQPDPHFWGDVHITDPAQAAPVMIQMKFVRKTADEMDAFFQANRDRAALAAVEEIALDWREVDREFTRESLALVLQAYPRAGADIISAYVALNYDARRKN